MAKSPSVARHQRQLASLLLSASVALTGLSACAQSAKVAAFANVASPSAVIPHQLPSTHMTTWNPQCVGRVLMQFPEQGKGTWSAKFDSADYTRLQQPLSRDQFWQGIEQVKTRIAAQKHRKVPNRLAHYEALNERAAFLAYYDNDVSLAAPRSARYLWLDDTHAYQLDELLPIGRKNMPTPALFGPYTAHARQVFDAIKPLAAHQLPQEPGFCVNGALITGDTGRNASTNFSNEFSRGIELVLAYAENLYQVAIYNGFGHLAFDELRAKESLKHRETAYQEFTVLRKQERVLDGLIGQEFITRTINHEGVKFYRFWWNVRGSNDGGVNKPSVAVHMSTPTSSIEYATKTPYPALPPEKELIDLWDHVLTTFRVLPKPLPGGQKIAAFNDDDGLTPWHAPQ